STYRRSGHINKHCAPRSSKMTKNIFDGFDERRSWNKEESRNDRRDNEFEQVDAKAARHAKQSATHRLEVGDRLRQQRSQISRCQVPCLIRPVSDQRPSLDGFGGGARRGEG